jgi:hypothetical protein
VAQKESSQSKTNGIFSVEQKESPQSKTDGIFSVAQKESPQSKTDGIFNVVSIPTVFLRLTKKIKYCYDPQKRSP